MLQQPAVAMPPTEAPVSAGFPPGTYGGDPCSFHDQNGEKYEGGSLSGSLGTPRMHKHTNAADGVTEEGVAGGCSARRSCGTATPTTTPSPNESTAGADRYRLSGEAGMADRSSRPHTSPRRAPTRTERWITKVRILRRWGPARIAHLLSLDSRPEASCSRSVRRRSAGVVRVCSVRTGPSGAVRRTRRYRRPDRVS